MLSSLHYCYYTAAVGNSSAHTHMYVPRCTECWLIVGSRAVMEREDLDVSWSFKKWLQREIQSVLKNNIMI